MDDIRIIKKYPNRRLYDTAVSRYITLDEIRELVIKHIRFKVIDTRSDEDKTNDVLLQIISDQESKSAPIFTTEILLNIIRFYGNPLQSMFSDFLEKMVSTDFSKVFQQSPMFNTLSELAKQNISIWQNAYDQFLHDKAKTKSKKDST